IGVEMLGQKVAQVPDLTGEPFPSELLLRLKHMILSHHGSYEFGSPRLPMTPEAIALHHLDNFDAKVHSFTRDIREDANKASAWTPFSQSLQRRLFKGGAETDGVGAGRDASTSFQNRSTVFLLIRARLGMVRSTASFGWSKSISSQASPLS